MNYIRRITRALILPAVIFAAGCSTVTSTYTSSGYNPDTLKHVVLVINIRDDKDGIAPLVKDIAYDIFSLRTDYLIHDIVIAKGDWKAACGKKEVQGILLVTVDKYSISGKNSVDLLMECELYSCAAGRTLWKAGASAKSKSDNDDLKVITGSYVEKYPGTAGVFTAPVFLVIQDFADIIPQPELTGEEIDIKIRLESEREE